MNGLKLGSIMLASLGFLFFNSPVSAQNNLRADLESFQEVPPISSPASGQFRAKVIKNTSIEYTLSYKGLEEDVTVTQSHIHFGQPGVNGGIVVFLCQVEGTSVDPTGLAPQCPASREGSVSGTLTSANLVAVPLQGIEGITIAELLRAIREDVTYVNVHTTKFGSGEIRGQIK
jgi:CHRD domain